MPTSSHLPPQWQRRLLAVLNAHGWDTGQWSHESDRLLSAWAQTEGGTAAYNPLNTTLRLNGSTQYNSIGVQNYTRPTYGVIATALTLLAENSDGTLRYGGIVAALQGGTLTAEQIVEKNRPLFALWGTDTALLERVLAETP